MHEDSSNGGEQVSSHDKSDIEVGNASKGPAIPARRALILGAAATSAVVSVRPAMAQTAYSVLTCQITVPSPQDGPVYIDQYGNIVDQTAPGATVLPPRTFTGQEILEGRHQRGPRAYRDLIGKLQPGQSGFTCYASIQGRRI
ncbi:hypothetical protein ACR9YC_08105 [Parasphingorhabdus sp. DH2-15]|uniref:hypothetical protein n=1 Tax=Parasphingorhabdus sp. DH2-15 TaxID=3444112 RepID=UPI003F687B72